MKAAQMNGYGPVEDFEIVDIPVREPGPGDVLIKVAYSSLLGGKSEPAPASGAG